jgi:hypothetical protein
MADFILDSYDISKLEVALDRIESEIRDIRDMIISAPKKED